MDFEKGVATGKCLWIKDDSLYEGAFKDGVFHGYGRLIYRNGDYYEGFFKNGQRNGQGEYVSYDRNLVYIGGFFNNEYDGYGDLKNNRVGEPFLYTGPFKGGKMEGKDGIYETDLYVYQGIPKNFL